MVLSFAAIESYSASVAFAMQSDHRFSGFDFHQYRKTRPFWDKVGLLMAAAEIEIDKSKALFHNIRQMQEWRILVTHASPYAIEPTGIYDTTMDPRQLHERLKEHQ